MDKEGLPKQLADNIGRNFNLVFNQVCMYNVYHKSVQGSLERVMESFQAGFDNQPTIAISLNQEQVCIEDDALDSRINTSSERIRAKMLLTLPPSTFSSDLMASSVSSVPARST